MVLRYFYANLWSLQDIPGFLHVCPELNQLAASIQIALGPDARRSTQESSYLPPAQTRFLHNSVRNHLVNALLSCCEAARSHPTADDARKPEQPHLVVIKNSTALTQSAWTSFKVNVNSLCPTPMKSASRKSLIEWSPVIGRSRA